MKTKTCYRILGIMSGTSLDGVDFADCKFSKGKSWHYEIKKTQTIAYSKKWRERLSNLHKKSDKEIDKTLYYFYADYCGYCKRFNPLWEKLKQDMSHKINFIKIDGKDKNNRFLLNKYNI